jgi:hypothetical protein
VRPAEVVMTKRGPWIPPTHARAVRASKPFNAPFPGVRLTTHDEPPLVVTCSDLPQSQI